MFKNLIKEVEAAIINIDREIYEFKCGNCKYKIQIKNLRNFLDKLKSGGVLNHNKNRYYRHDYNLKDGYHPPDKWGHTYNPINAIKNFIKNGEFSNAIEACKLANLNYGLGLSANNHLFIYFPIVLDKIRGRDVFIHENIFYDILSGYKLGTKEGIEKNLCDNYMLNQFTNVPDNTEIIKKLVEEGKIR